MRFPDGFKEKIRHMLGREAEDFFACCDRPRRRSLRVNTAKIQTDDLMRLVPFARGRVPWADDGLYIADDARPARHPFYAAGLYYMQEASAMAPAALFPMEEGDRVLDLCAAPGGKATELAVRLAAAGGVLVANEMYPSRAKALLRNLELTGTSNYCVLNERPDRLAAAFPQFFDKILVDAPCSGEGMFRKEEDAVRLWSPERVASCAGLQEDILEQAYKMLRPGGMLMYSTCTFSPEENEEQVAAFMLRHADVSAVPVKRFEGFSPGIETPAVKRMTGDAPEVTDRTTREIPAAPEKEVPVTDDDKNRIRSMISDCVRLWPHRVDGEGHFLVLLRKGGSGAGERDAGRAGDAAGEKNSGRGGDAAGRRRRNKKQRPSKKEAAPSREMLGQLDVFIKQTGTGGSSVTARGSRAYIPALDDELLEGLHVLRNGLYLGEWKKNRFEPSQALALSVAAAAAERKVCLGADDPLLADFLAGNSITIPDEGPLCGRGTRKDSFHDGTACDSMDVAAARGVVQPEEKDEKTSGDGWTVVCAEKYPVGWGRKKGSSVKNRMPAGWRRQ